MTTYIIAILIGLLIGVLTYFILNKINLNSPVPQDQFQRSQKKIINTLQEKKDSFDKELSQEQLKKKEQVQKEIDRLTQKFDEEKEHYNTRLSDLEKDYQEKRATAIELDKNAEAARVINNQEKIESEQTRLNNELNKLSKKYKEEQNKIEKDFFQFSEQINTKKAELTKEIQLYEERQKEIIARFKLDEERKQQSDFYKIKINDIEKVDIIKLKSLSTAFSKPEVLLKLIYEIYYKNRLEELFKRVLGEDKNKGGIYKITNINNNKIYIGKTTKFLDRWRTHAKRGCGIERISGQLYDALFDEGLENFMWEVVEVCSKEEQSEKEKYWINFYNSDQYGYNQRKG